MRDRRESCPVDFAGGYAGAGGGGIAAWEGGSPTIADCVISNNVGYCNTATPPATTLRAEAPSYAANIGDSYAVFEPTHGSAPKYDGMYKVNPMAMLLTVKLMFDWLEETALADRLDGAIAAVIREQKVGTYDVGLSNTTLEVAEEVARQVTEGARV
jgi:3-isopropylmalate dehydrogenase